MSDSSVSISPTNRSINFTESLTVLLLGLKLTGHIDWSWWWVFSPTLIWVAVTFLVMVLVAAFAKV